MIRYVNKIEMIEAKHLSSSTIIKKTGIVIPEDVEFTPVETIGLSSIEISDTIKNKERIFTSKLQAFLPKILDIGNKKLCFRVTTVQKEVFVLGTSYRPFPIIELNDNYPNTPASKCGCTMTVTYTNTIPMLSVLV